MILKSTLFKYSKELHTRNYPRAEVIGTLKEIRDILLKTHTSNSRKSFFYNSLKDLFKSQLHLLELGTHCVQFADVADYQLRCYYYNILTLLFLRGEFNIENIRFKESLNGEMLDTKKKIGLQFQAILYKALWLSLSKFSMRGLTADQQEFVETFLAVAFFRVPEFRAIILDTLHKDSDVNNEEWKQLAKEEETKNIGIFNVFNWSGEFYAYLPSCREKSDSEIFLDKVLNLTEWKSRMRNRGVSFFRFVTHWARLVSGITASEGIPWQNIPGYTVVIKAVLNEIKDREIISFPEALKEALITLLINENILTALVKIVFQKTSVYDFRSINEALELTNSWFQTVCVKYGKTIPSNFDFNFFFKAIEILLNMDNPMGCEKCLWLIYKIAHFLPSIFCSS